MRAHIPFGRPRLRRPSPALVLSFMALFVALSGMALALERNSVTSKHIRNNAVKSVDLKDGKGVGGVDVKDASITGADLASDSITGGELITLQEETADVLVGGGVAHNGEYNVESTNAVCDPGDQLIAGGVDWVGGFADDELFIGEIDPNFVTNAVHVEGGNDSGTDRTLRVIAICLDA